MRGCKLPTASRKSRETPKRLRTSSVSFGADGRGVKLEGKLTFSGTVRVDATFQGEIVTDGVLVVGEGAKVDAEIACGTVVVEGDVKGNIIASQGVELHASGRLHGDVESPSFAIDRGAIFEGSSRRPGGGSSSDRRAGKHAASQHH